MANVTIAVGVVLVLLGLGGYFGMGQTSMTALIPSFLGAPLVVLGLLARDEARRKLMMHIAVVIGLVGFLGTVRGLSKLPALLGGAEVARPQAVVVQSIVAVLCAVFIGLCVKSFIDARRARA